MLNKNDEFEILITDMGSDGEGIGRYEGMTFFIKGAVIGDRVLAGVTKLKKTYGYARLISVIEPSPDRVEAPCPLAKRCGGCQLQQLSYAKQLEYKENKVRNDLIRLGGIDESELTGFKPIIGMDEPVHYRNKGQFPVGTNRDGKIVSGFYAGHTHSIIETDSCMIQHPITDTLMEAVRTYMTKEHVSAYNEETGRGLVRHVLTRVGFTTHEVMVCVVINGRKLPNGNRLTEALEAAVADYNERCFIKAVGTGPKYLLESVTVNINTENTNVILGEECRTLHGKDYIEDYIGDVRYRISPLSFYQVNPVQTKKLYSTALEYAGLTGNETVWDLYCGIGTISLFLAQKAKKVYGVEVVPPAIEDARRNAQMNGIKNAEFFVGAAEEVLPAKYREDPSMRADTIVVDPPRKGCDEKLLECLVNLEPKKIVYVSCDPATLSRDVKYLREKGYALTKVQPVDMFPESVHVETVVLLSQLRQKSDD